jgi:ketosteroid isomerase-like protein
MANSANKDGVLRFLDLLGRGDFEGAAELFAEGATFWVPGSLPFSGTLHGRQEILEKNLLPSRSLTVPGTASLEVGTVVAEGAYVAAEWIFRRKTLDGRDYENTFFGLFQMRNGEIQSLREYLDTQYAKDMLWRD